MNQLSLNQVENVEGIREEYESLRKRTGRLSDLPSYVYLSIHIIFATYVTLTAAITTNRIGTTILVAILSATYPGFLVSGLVFLIVYGLFGGILERYLERRRLVRSWYQRYLYLKNYIEDYDEAERLRKEEQKRIEAEAKRVWLLPLHNAIREFHVQLREYDELVSDLDEFFRRKKKWYSEYRPFEQNINQCVERLNDLEGEGRRLEEKLVDLARESPTSFPYLFESISRTRRKFEWLLEKMQSMKNWTPPIGSTSPQATVRLLTGSGTQPPKTPKSRATIAESEALENEYDFSFPTDIKQPIVVVPPSPPKRRVQNRRLKKIPFEDYVGAAKAKMTIGELGEVVVLHYEIRRVDEESGRYGAHRVRRVSEESDSFGYDIESFSQGEKVFIEVKSTSGPFWTDFILTANERNVMKELGDKYWLYRIFELSQEDGSAKLSIFRGRFEIENSFDLEPSNYKLKPKSQPNPENIDV